MLKTIEQQASASLRQRMEKAGCAFDFLVCALDAGEAITPAYHRQAVDQLFLAIKHLWLERHRQMILDPRCAGATPPDMAWDLDMAMAMAKPLNRQEIAQLMDADKHAHNPPPFALYEAFCEPPYGTRFSDGDSDVLFREWLDLLGLEAGVEVEVLNWVDNFNVNWLASDEPDPARDPWSDYFDDGLQWWGVWCLSVWNSQRRTLSVLAASITD
ncbi:hypothetical protein [Pseudomonas corrugata]|uniref:hypothetical protein n=1 Tax=Pseudomonas corrugata TaxID=47879 RepID=UPI002234D140|nr:hypothetical protein [Pseudomonas corrugata]UZE08724.1 hypothetical protein LOY65_12685 [Pseudomonas corrugata]